MFIYFQERQRQCEQGRVRERRETQNPKQAPGSRLWAVSTEPDTGLKPTNCEIMTWAEVRGLSDWATEAPQNRF